MVFQNYALYPHMTVFDNMAFGLKLRKVPKQNIDRARAGGGEDPRPRGVPGPEAEGAVRRAAAARGDGSRDRPRAEGVPDGRAAVEPRREAARADALGDRAGSSTSSTTTIYVTHDQVEAMTMGDRVAVIRKGVLQQVDAPQYLYDHPENLFVAGFIGSPAMNMVEATCAIERFLPVEFGGFACRPRRGVAHAPRAEGVREQADRRRHPPGGHGGCVAGPRRAGGAAGSGRACSSGRPSARMCSSTSGSRRRSITEDTKELAGDVGQEALEAVERARSPGSRSSSLA